MLFSDSDEPDQVFERRKLGAKVHAGYCIEKVLHVEQNDLIKERTVYFQFLRLHRHLSAGTPAFKLKNYLGRSHETL